MMRRARLTVLLPAAALCATVVVASEAPDPNRFAQRFPLAVAPESGLFAVDLTPPVYAELTRDDRRDLVVVDAQGRAQSAMWMDVVAPDRAPIVSERAARLFPVAGDAPDAEALRLEITRPASGSGRDVSVTVAAPAGMESTAATVRQWWLDAGNDAPYTHLRVTLADGHAEVRELVDVDGSDDLQRWQPIRRGETLLSVGSDGDRLERLDLPLGEQRFRYLRVVASGDSSLPAVKRVVLVHRDWSSVDSRRAAVTVQGISDADGTWRYPLPGPLPIRDWQITAEQAFAVHATLLAPDPLQPGERWRAIADGPQFQIPQGDGWLRADPIALYGPSPRTVRLQAAGLNAAPAMVFGYHPDRLLVLAQGPAPYALLAGSARWTLPPGDVTAALSAVRAGQRRDWTPPVAHVGPPVALAGDAAKRPSRIPDGGTLALWAVLVAGVLAVAGTAWRLLRDPQVPASPGSPSAGTRDA